MPTLCPTSRTATVFATNRAMAPGSKKKMRPMMVAAYMLSRKSDLAGDQTTLPVTASASVVVSMRAMFSNMTGLPPARLDGSWERIYI